MANIQMPRSKFKLSYRFKIRCVVKGIAKNFRFKGEPEVAVFLKMRGYSTTTHEYVKMERTGYSIWLSSADKKQHCLIHDRGTDASFLQAILGERIPEGIWGKQMVKVIGKPQR